MHDNEFFIDESLVRKLLQSQQEELSNLPLLPVSSHGSDHALFRLGENYVIRLPRVAGAVKGIEKESIWTPKLSKHFNIPTSKPAYVGKSEAYYPYNWLIMNWIEGNNPDFEKTDEHSQIVKDLAHFINTLHGIKLVNGPRSRRGIPLTNLDQQVKECFTQISNEYDTIKLNKIWQSIIDTPYWNKELVWIHGDLHQGNILCRYNRLAGVIDFSDIGMGDPATDLMIAWTLLNKNSREQFKNSLLMIDECMWIRGKGWALSMAAIMLPYYKSRNPYYAKLARRIIDEIINH